ncbi:MAG: pyrroline-5-carboxylate reductase [Candidatus Omnitrophica bacterium]|nr:pyrroline-5-carboxylate reductase [Candidatus Omnitrophota bacterium]
MIDKIIGIIGCGSMGSAIIERLKDKYKVFVYDAQDEKVKVVAGVNVAASAQDLIANSDIIILAVKPQDLGILMAAVMNQVKGKLVISIAAGIKTSFIEKILGEVSVIRAMPNIGAKIGHSVTCLCKGSFAKDIDLVIARELFRNIGTTHSLSEEMMDGVTAISGSGPGYYFEMIDKNITMYESDYKKFSGDFSLDLKDAAMSIGFDEATARFLANSTVIASDLLLKITRKPAAELRDMVASPKGTTQAGLEILRRGGKLIEAVQAAYKRAQELSK